MATVTVQIGYSPEVSFDVPRLETMSTDFQIVRVLELWQSVTGLCWKKMMSRQCHIKDGITYVVVENPLDNRPDARFMWSV